MKRPYSSERSCSPKSLRNGGGNIQTCFSWQSLIRIAKRYNETNPKDKIVLYRSRDRLWREIRSKMPECNDERCWIRAKYLPSSDRNVLLEDFKPPLPRGKYDWLNTDDIERVLKSYEKVFPAFISLGAHPIDFQSVYPDKFNPLNVAGLLRSGKRFAGMVLNLDRSDQPGSHWVAIFLDLKRKTFEYYDSYGYKAGKNVKTFFATSFGPGWEYKENTQTHQRKNSECGVYSIHFIVRRVSGEPFERVVNNIIRDEEMNSYRSRYFDPYERYDNS